MKMEIYVWSLFIMLLFMIPLVALLFYSLHWLSQEVRSSWVPTVQPQTQVRPKRSAMIFQGAETNVKAEDTCILYCPVKNYIWMHCGANYSDLSWDHPKWWLGTWNEDAYTYALYNLCGTHRYCYAYTGNRCTTTVWQWHQPCT